MVIKEEAIVPAKQWFNHNEQVIIQGFDRSCLEKFENDPDVVSLCYQIYPLGDQLFNLTEHPYTKNGLVMFNEEECHTQAK